MNPTRGRLAVIGCLLVAAFWSGSLRAATPAGVGERIYREGILPDGVPVHATRGDVAISGSVTACVNCHRRSGLGSAEGFSRIPPITSAYLFAPSGPQRAARNTGDTVDGAPYDATTLRAAISSGVGRGGKPLSPLMPRYDLDGGSMSALVSYLEALPTVTSPGVSASTIDFATIVTPDADPRARDGMLAVLEQFFDDKNAFQRGGAKPLRSDQPIHYRVTRTWRLHVWTLVGTPDTWEAQLRKHLRAEPVFAVLSGIGGATWAPIHRVCESERLPCLFPNLKSPVDSEGDFYSLYLSKGVLLDAELIAARLAGYSSVTRLVQVADDSDGAQAAAAKLRSLLPSSMQSVMRTVRMGDAAALAAAVGEAYGGDALVLWLTSADVAGLSANPPLASVIYLSGTEAGLEHAPVPPAWRRAVELPYPADLPAARAVRMNYPLRWFQIRHVAVVDEKVQADTYLACGIVSEAINEMLDSFMRDFLIERIESMVSHRQLSGYYPRLGLGVGQRFASKGGYMVRFASDSGETVVRVSDWMVP